MAPERSQSEKGRGFFTRLFRRSSSTQGRPTISHPDPFSSQNQLRPQDLYTLQDARDKKKRPANVPSSGVHPSSSQGTQQHRPDLSFSERMKSDFRAGVDETNAAFRSDPSTASRRRERETPHAPPQPAHLSNSRPPPRHGKETIRPFAISAPIGPANLADSAHDAAARKREKQKQQERERALAKVSKPIQTVQARRIQLNPPAPHQSMHALVSGNTSSNSSHSTRWEDFIGPPPTAPPAGPLPPLPSAHRSTPRHGPPPTARPATPLLLPLPVNRFTTRPGTAPTAPPRGPLPTTRPGTASTAPPRNPLPTTRHGPAPTTPPTGPLPTRPTRTPAPASTSPCGVCRAAPSLPASTLCDTCSFRAYRHSRQRRHRSPSPVSPLTPPLAHSSYTQRSQRESRPVSPLTPPLGDEAVHPALRRRSHRFPFETGREEGLVGGDVVTAGFAAQMAGDYVPREPRRGAVSGAGAAEVAAAAAVGRERAVRGGGERRWY